MKEFDAAIQVNELTRVQLIPDSRRKDRRASRNERGLSPWTLWPEFSMRTDRPLGRERAKLSAASSVRTSLRAPRTTRVGHLIFDTSEASRVRSSVKARLASSARRRWSCLNSHLPRG